MRARLPRTHYHLNHRRQPRQPPCQWQKWRPCRRFRRHRPTRHPLEETIIPHASALAQPALAQSNEPIVFNGRTYTVYQINEGGASFRDATFARADEIWRSTLLTTPQQQWLLTDSLTATAEPEPFVGTSRVWVFYNVIEGDNPLTATWRLYRAETPIR
ncbi:MAG: hypothetical protein ACUVSY_10305 [Roseiflexus sp.]